MTEKIAVLAPMPRARVRTATTVKAGGLRSSMRSAWRKSRAAFVPASRRCPFRELSSLEEGGYCRSAFALRGRALLRRGHSCGEVCLRRAFRGAKRSSSSRVVILRRALRNMPLLRVIKDTIVTFLSGSFSGETAERGRRLGVSRSQFFFPSSASLFPAFGAQPIVASAADCSRRCPISAR